MIKIRIISIIIIFFCSAAHAEDFYVCPSSAGLANGSSIANCWDITSLSTAGNWGAGAGKISAGDTVYLQGGTYTATDNRCWNLGGSGSEGSPVTIRPASASSDPDKNSGNVDFTGADTYGIFFEISGASYVTIDGRTSDSDTTSNIVFRNSLNTGAIYSSGASPNNGIVLKYLTFKDSNAGIYLNMGSGGNDTEIAYNTFSGMNLHRSALITGSGTTDSGNLLIHHNTFVGGFDSARSIGFNALNVTCPAKIYNNSFITNALSIVGDPTDDHGDSIQTTTCAGDFHVYNNRFLGAQNDHIIMEPNEASVDGIYIYNNLFEGGSVGNKRGIEIVFKADVTAVTNLVVQSNTFVDVHDYFALQIAFSNGTETVTNTIIRNNIFFNCGDSTHAAVLIWPADYTAGSGVVFDYNLVNAGNSGVTLVTIHGDSYTQDHPQTAAPSFVSYTENGASNNLSLSSADTAAKDNGVALAATYNTDKNGTSRPQGAAWDIGAMEYVPPSIFIGSGGTITFGSGGTITLGN